MLTLTLRTDESVLNKKMLRIVMRPIDNTDSTVVFVLDV